MSTWRNKQSIVWQGAILVLVPISLGLITLSTLAYLLYQAELETKWESQQKTISSLTSKLSSSILDGFLAISCYVYFKDRSFLRRYDQVAEEARQAQSKLAQLVKDQPEQLETLRHVSELHEKAVEAGKVICALMQRGLTSDSFFLQGSKTRQMQALITEHQSNINKFRKRESQYSHPHSTDSLLWRKRVENLILLAAAANVFLSIALAIFYSLNIRRRLDFLRENADRLAKNAQLLPALSGRDEIARLDIAFRLMAKTLKEMALKEAALVDNARDVICSVNGARQFTMVSAGAKKLWGYLPEELVGKSIDSIVQEQSHASVLPGEHKEMSELPASFENKLRHKDGSIVNMLWSARWSQAEKSYFCVVHDITARKKAEDLLRESESRLRTIIESMPVALVIASAEDGRITATNQTTLNLLEYPALEQVVGSSLSKLIPAYEEDSEDPLKMLEMISLFPVGRLKAAKAGGGEVPVQISLKHFFYQGAPFLLVTMLDMTERYKAEVLTQEFVSMIRNDLKEPLLYVQSVLSIFAGADEKRFTERGMLLVKRSELEAERLLSLVTELLNAEQPLSSLPPTLDAKLNSLETIVGRSIESVRLLADKCNVSIVDSTESCLIESDQDRLIQVLVNLLANAIKFSPPESTITITSASSDQWIELRVIDQGRGIPASHRESIFKRFVQVEASDATVRRGTGLGLSICRSIVEAHHGTIGVDSEEGKGSSFWFRLPRTAMGG